MVAIRLKSDLLKKYSVDLSERRPIMPMLKLDEFEAYLDNQMDGVADVRARKKKNNGSLLSITSAAKSLEISRATLRHHIKAGRIKTVSGYFIDKGALERFKNEHQSILDTSTSLSETDLNLIRDVYSGSVNLSINEVSEQLGVSRRTVLNLANTMGCNVKPKKTWSKDELDTFSDLLKKKSMSEAIAEMKTLYGRTERALRLAIYRYELAP